MARQLNGDGGFSNPKVFDTEAEAAAHAQKVAGLEAALDAMTPQDRAEWFAINGNTPIEDLEL